MRGVPPRAERRPFLHPLPLPAAPDMGPTQASPVRTFTSALMHPALHLGSTSRITISPGATFSQLSCWKTVLSSNGTEGLVTALLSCVLLFKLKLLERMKDFSQSSKSSGDGNLDPETADLEEIH